MKASSSRGIPIGVVERDTGIAKDTLRVWERRYGFPQPVRDEHGDRLYPPAQVRRLHRIRRLLDAGHRPAAVVGASDHDLSGLQDGALEAEPDMGAGLGRPTRSRGRPPKDLSSASASQTSGAAAAVVDETSGALLRALFDHDVAALRATLVQSLAQSGLQRFVMETLPRMHTQVGTAWVEGRLAVFEEHLYTEQVKSLLRQAMGQLAPPRPGPTVLLTTVPGEHHLLGLLMIEALFQLRGVGCIALGTQTPVDDIVAAAAAHKVTVVLLSFSAAFPRRALPALLGSLRQRLPAHVHLWAGGAGVRQLPPVAGVSFGHSLEEALVLLEELQRQPA